MSADGALREYLWDTHRLIEAQGGYIECFCGWPTREQYDSGEHPVEHIVEALKEVGHER